MEHTEWACIPGRGRTRSSQSAALGYAHAADALGGVDEAVVDAQDGACASAVQCGGGAPVGHVWRWPGQVRGNK